MFAHSQGALISEHALELLAKKEREKICIFTFGGASLIAPGKSHPDSHNYASASDLICRIGSPNLQILALQRYYGLKEGLSEEQIIRQLAIKDAMLALDTSNPETIELYAKHRTKYYEKEFAEISNVTILDPGDPSSTWEHEFKNSAYQNVVAEIIKKYKSSQIIENSADTAPQLICDNAEDELAMAASI